MHFWTYGFISCSVQLPPRTVSQVKEVAIVTRSLGTVRVFTLKGYRNFYGRDPSEDGVTPESWTTPKGETIQAYKAGAWETFFGM